MTVDELSERLMRILAQVHEGEGVGVDAEWTLGDVPRPDAFPDPEAQTLRCAEQQALWRAYRRLSPDDQEVLRLAAWEELPHEEIGVALGCDPAAARQRLHRARARLAKQLQRAQRPLAGARRHDDE